ncbi:hypothetical protein LPJ72_004996 [Coemansia sp. Benny D160-2]|nr:hypothetical protein LPJ72_004996 [Coemansia sp. Benny D160-2]
MAYSLAAATSDSIRLWDLSVSGGGASKQPLYQGHYLDRRRGTLGGSSDHGTGPAVRVAEEARYAAEGAAGAVGRIATVSWATDAATFVVGGGGTSLRQYSRTGEALQDIELSRRTEAAAVSEIVAVQHYGGATEAESMFVASNATRQVRRWDLAKREYTTVCQTHENNISCLAVSVKRRLVASATAQGGEIALFNLLYNTRTDLRSATQRALTCIDISAGHRAQVAVGSEDGLVQLFDASRSDTSPAKTFPLVHAAPIRGLAFRNAGGAIVSAGLDSRIVVTDPRAYSSKAAVAMDADAPLTCLAGGCPDASVVAAGSIDGEVLMYDIRAPSAPVWKASVAARKAVVAVQLAQQRAEPNSAASGARELSHPSALLRTTGKRDGESRVAGRASARIGHVSSEEDLVSSPFGERRRRRGTATNSEANADTNRWPPQHPSINRYRAALSELRRSSAAFAPASAGKMRPAVAGGAEPAAKRARSPKTFANTFGSDDNDDDNDDAIGDAEQADEHLDNMAILAKDRSYMELLSPAKLKQMPTPAAIARPPPPKSGADDILALLARSYRKPDEKETVAQKKSKGETQHKHLSAEKQASSHRSKRHYDYDSDFFDDFGASPIARPATRGHTQDPPPRHDVGDSMMEMFTPERKRRDAEKTADHSTRDSAQAGNTDAAATGGRSAQGLVARLLSKQSEAAAVETPPQPTLYENLLDDSPVSASGRTRSPERPPVPRRDEGTAARNRFSSRPGLASTRKDQPPLPPLPPLLSKPRPGGGDTPLTALSAGSSVSTVADPDLGHSMRTGAAVQTDLSKSTPPELSQRQQPDAPTAGLGSVSGSVLQNMLTDTLVPLREQFSSQIRNLHLDMVRQSFVHQEQIQALRSECNDSRLLRDEVDRLRQENEELKRYIPLYHVFDKDAGALAPDSGPLRRDGL